MTTDSEAALALEPGGDAGSWSAAQLARLLGLPAPTPEQAAVIESDLDPAVVIAGAGSGKTETMAGRVVWLVANGRVHPDEILGLTFTRKAAAELSRRIRRRLTQWRRIVERTHPDQRERVAELLAGEPTVLTYAAYAGRVVSEHAMRLGAEPGARLLSPAQCWQFADDVSRRHPGTLPADIGAPASVPRWVQAMSGALADHLVTADELEQYCQRALRDFERLPRGARARSDRPKRTKAFVETTTHRLALVPLVRAYAAAKTSAAAVDFADQMVLAARLARLPDVATGERQRYAAVLLDEYQDTGHAQVEMLRGLFGDGHPVTAVGDPFQSIYGWRGASAGNIGRFATDFPVLRVTVQRGRRPEPARVYPLATSFRNDRAILAAANAVSAALRSGITDLALRPAPGAGPGTITAARLATVEAEAEWVAERMRTAWHALAPGARTAAVLVRRRSQIPLLAEAVQAVGLPVEVVGLGGLLTTPEVLDVVSTLKVLVRHDAGTALARLLTGARWRIGPADLAALRDRADRLTSRGAHGPAVEAVTIVEALDDLGPAGQYSRAGYRRMAALADELRQLRRRVSAPLPELVADVERTLGLDIEVAARAGRVETGRTHLDRFVDVAAGFAADAEQATLPAFLAFLEAAEEEENGLDAGEVVVDTERVQILTVHGAKGLEWDIVALPGLVGGVFPADPRAIDWTRTRQELPSPLRGDRNDLPTLVVGAAGDRCALSDLLDRHHDEFVARHHAEERRLAYVALTRARSTLIASTYVWDGGVKPREPAPYLGELTPFGRVEEWYEPEPDESNPLTSQVRASSWPVDPFGRSGPGGSGRRAAVESGAALVRDAAAQSRQWAPAQRLPIARPPLASTPRAEQWQHEVDRLLAERAQRAINGTDVVLPNRLSVSELVELAQDPAELARTIARPMPRRPAPWARRGTQFHRWLETRWGAQPLLDVDELPGAADESARDASFAQLRDAFLASRWAHRTPIEVEVPFEMALHSGLAFDGERGQGRVVRGRMDAVFRDPDGGWTVVDWKTGARPTAAAAEAAAVQLAAYRLAWARLCGLSDAELPRVRAVFHYVASNETVTPNVLLDADGLRSLVAGSLVAGQPVAAIPANTSKNTA